MAYEFDAYKALINCGPFPEDKTEADRLFLAAVKESFGFHYGHCAPFANYCKNRTISPMNLSNELADFPYLPVAAFKLFGRDLLVTKASDEKTFIMNSSATSGQPSSISVSRSAAKRQAISMAKVMSAFIGSKKRPFIVFDVDPKADATGAVGARYGATVGYLNFSSRAHFVLKDNGLGVISLDHEALSRAIEDITSLNQPPIIFGFTFVLFDVLSKLENKKPLAFFSNGTILHIGGWKKLEAHKVSKSDFNQFVASRFGTDTSNVIDVYGFTEQMGINYPSCGLNDKIAPNFARVLVRHPDSLKVLPAGEEGLLQFISPLPISYPGISVLTDDMGTIIDDFGEVDGHWGTRFQVTGRAKNAEVRGCGDIMSSYLSRTAADSGAVGPTSAPRLMFLEKSYVPTRALETFVDFDRLPEVEDYALIENKLRENIKKLHKYSVDDLIGFFAIASQMWLDEDSPMRHLQRHGLSFLVNWLSAENLRAMLNKSLKGNRVALDRFVRDEEFPVRLLRAAPRGLVGHWLAGNVPMLGMLGLVQSILTKNANIIRVPASNTAVMPVILDVISKTKITLADGTVVDGADIAASTGILYYDKADTTFANQLSRSCDARIAWGGAEAVSSVAALDTNIDCQTVIFGPKLSFMAIGREMFSEGENINKLFRRIATDCSVFDQYACASPHTIFVENNDTFTPQAFCARLAQAMEAASNQLPKEAIDPGTSAKIVSRRIEYDLRGQTWQSDGTTWTVAYNKDQTGLVPPTYSRFITVVFVDDIMEAASFAHNDIQTISIAMPYDKKIRFAEIAARQGAIRFPEIGRMTHFETPWDGLFPMDRLVKFVTLGGPAV